MPVSPQFLQFALDQLGGVRPVSSRRMFGGVGFYAGELFFAIADNDTIYLKVDDATRGAYEREGMRPFQPFGPGTAPMRGYFELPPRLFEDVEELADWVRAALTVAATAAAQRKRPVRPRRRTAALPRKSAPSRKRPRKPRAR